MEPDGADEPRWRALERQLLGGITHALSNRAASVAAISALAEPGETWTPRLAGMLGAEGTNLESLVRGLRLLITDPALGAEPIELATVVPALVALHDHHPALRDVECIVERAGERGSVTEPPAMFVQRLLLQIDAARRDAQPSGGRVLIRWGGEPAVEVAAVS